MTEKMGESPEFEAALVDVAVAWCQPSTENKEMDIDLAKEFAKIVVRRESALRERVEQLQVQLAGCGVIAMGYDEKDNPIKHGEYGWSQSLEDVRTLRKRWESLDKGEFARQYNENLELKERVLDLEQLIDSIEWWTDPSLPDHRMCLVCDAYEEHGHKPDCKRQKLLHPEKKALGGA